MATLRVATDVTIWHHWHGSRFFWMQWKMDGDDSLKHIIYILYILYIYNISVRERDRERLRIHIDLHVQTTLCDAGLVCTTDEVRPD
jgi:hypothetical protein